ncbi:MAG: ATP-dependent zinc protease [Verrucomicrobia bacterium]|nr:ATP-dependent zinc protease [Verrucomicrobiota bacterium]
MDVMGWREWVSLPELGIPLIKAKVDTGARTSCLHAFSVTPFEESGRKRVRFSMHPMQGRSDLVVHCVADFVGHRIVTDSGGHRERRQVIATPILVHGVKWTIELTLTDRDCMRFRMLLGRTGLRGRVMVDPSRSFVSGRIKKVDVMREYQKIGETPGTKS